MQDIDFDELDRAVSSVSDPDPAPAAVKTDTSDGDAITVNSSASSSSSSSMPAARRSSGRFMDVVHPSSDMRSSSSVPERSTPRVEPPKERDEPVSSHTDWPDPLDFHGFNIDEPAEAEKKPVDLPAPEEKTDTEEPVTQPLDSPFLSDTKVEKRPLGAFSTNDLPTANESDENKSADEPAALLDEPSDELLLEATATPDAPEVPEVPEEKIEEAPAPSEPAPAPTPEPVEEAVSSGPTSITQQYKEHASTTEQPSGAIFDTEAYHQPLTHTKKKSGALIVVWIAALILVGAGVGAAVYFFVLPML